MGHSRSGGEGAPNVIIVCHKGEELQQVAAAVGLLNLFWSTGGGIEIPNHKSQITNK